MRNLLVSCNMNCVQKGNVLFDTETSDRNTTKLIFTAERLDAGTNLWIYWYVAPRLIV